MTKEEFQKHQEHVEKVKKNTVSTEPKVENEDISHYQNDKEDTQEDIAVVELKNRLNGSNKVTLDFSKINGLFLERCKQQYKNIKVVKKEVINIETLDDKYYVVVASNLTGASYMDIMELPYKDYKAILDEVRGFLN